MRLVGQNSSFSRNPRSHLKARRNLPPRQRRCFSKGRPKRSVNLFPKKKLPIDKIAEQIVRAFVARKPPPAKIEATDYSINSHTWLQRLLGKDFYLFYNRRQGKLPDGELNDLAGLSRVVLKERELVLDPDPWNCCYIRYVGKKWEKDFNQFWNFGFKKRSRLDEDPKYVVYLPSLSEDQILIDPERKPEYFVAHLSKGMSLPRGVPNSVGIQKVMKEIENLLKTLVLEPIARG